MQLATRVRAKLNRIAEWTKATGHLTTLRWGIFCTGIKLGLKEPAVWHVRPRQVSHPLCVRLRGTSDMPVFAQIFISQQYSDLKTLEDPSLILDLGANVGFSAAYFLNVFPNARVVAVEPDPDNLAICRENLSKYGSRVLLVPGAVWSRCATLQLLKTSHGDGRSWSFEVDEKKPGRPGLQEIQGWDVETLINMTGSESVDLLKVDIERAELSVFGAENAESWLKRVKNMCIELHGDDCAQVFFEALRNFDFDLGYSGELTVCRNLRPKRVGPRPEVPATSDCLSPDTNHSTRLLTLN